MTIIYQQPTYNMIKGLKQDHNVLLDLIFNHYHNIQTSLIQLFDIFIELFQQSQSAKLLECIYIKQKLTTINITEKYLKTLITPSSFHHITPLLKELDSITLPIFNKSLIILTSIHNDYLNTPYSHFYNLSMIKESVLTLSQVLNSSHSILIKFIEFISKCQIDENITKFSPNSFSETTMIIINFEGYEQLYHELFNDLYDLEEVLKDFKELIRKESPCFKEYTQKYHEHSLKDDEIDDGLFSQDVFTEFDQDDFEKFSKKRKIRIGIEKRKLFSEF